MVLEPIGQAAAAGEPPGGTWHYSSKAVGFPIPPAALKSSQPLPRVEGNSDLRALGQTAQRMEQRSPRSPLLPSVILPGVTSVQAGVLEVDGKNSGAYFAVKPLLRGVRASFFGVHPNRFLSVAIKVGGSSNAPQPPK